MRVSIEEYLLINFLMDALILMLTVRGTYFINPVRIFAAAALASAYALMDAYRGYSFYLDACALAVMLLAAFPWTGFGRFLRSCVVFIAGSFLMSGCVRFFLLRGCGTLLSGAAGVISAILAVSAAKGVLFEALSDSSVLVSVRIGSAVSRFTAIIDTGNLLKEPLSALPVLIADRKALGRAFHVQALSMPSPREVEYASVSGIGRLKCIRADSVQIRRRGKWVRAPDVWLGVHPGEMPGGVHALAPGVFNARFSILRDGG